MMEGMWTRCFPATKKVQAEIRSGSIGTVTQAWGDFGFFGTDDLDSFPSEMVRSQTNTRCVHSSSPSIAIHHHLLLLRRFLFILHSYFYKREGDEPC